MNLTVIKQQVIEVAKAAGNFIEREYHQFDQAAIEYKGINNMVSYVDKTAEKMIVEGLHKILPEAGFIAEEGTGEEKKGGLNWIIDPLDGTTNFIHGIPCFCVSIALVENITLQVGVIYDPILKECFHAAKGEKAYCNEKEISVANAELSKALVATGFPYYDFEKMPQYMEIIRKLMQQSHGLRRMGSAAIDLAYVACGRFDAFFEYNLNSWDVAAGILLVECAGGRVSDFKNGDQALFGRELIAASRPVQKELQTLIEHIFYQ